jgi:hypothetical protein
MLFPTNFREDKLENRIYRPQFSSLKFESENQHSTNQQNFCSNSELFRVKFDIRPSLEIRLVLSRQSPMSGNPVRCHMMMDLVRLKKKQRQGMNRFKRV